MAQALLAPLEVFLLRVYFSTRLITGATLRACVVGRLSLFS
jgi:hypothetical protein